MPFAHSISHLTCFASNKWNVTVNQILIVIVDPHEKPNWIHFGIGFIFGKEMVNNALKVANKFILFSITSLNKFWGCGKSFFISFRTKSVEKKVREGIYMRWHKFSIYFSSSFSFFRCQEISIFSSFNFTFLSILHFKDFQGKNFHSISSLKLLQKIKSFFPLKWVFVYKKWLEISKN